MLNVLFRLVSQNAVPIAITAILFAWLILFTTVCCLGAPIQDDELEGND